MLPIDWEWNGWALAFRCSVGAGIGWLRHVQARSVEHAQEIVDWVGSTATYGDDDMAANGGFTARFSSPERPTPGGQEICINPADFSSI
jgi:hypothetical protein